MVGTPVSWSQVVARLTPDRAYWLVTVSAEQMPHPVPVWGVVVDGGFYLYSARSTLKVRHLAANPQASIHSESGTDVVIVRGRLVDRGHPSAHPEVVAALDAKYVQPGDRDYLPSAAASIDIVYELKPEVALMWRTDDYEASQSRWDAS
jgi:hypothetical protein